MKRPLAVLCLIILSVVGVSLLLRPPEFRDFAAMEGQWCEVIGQVDKIEYKNGSGKEQSIIYLTQISYFQEVSEKENRKKIKQDNLSNNIQVDVDLPEGIACYISGDVAQMPRIGNYVLVRGDFAAFNVAANPGEFDARLYYRILGLEGQLRNVEIEQIGEDYNRLSDMQFRLRCFLEEKLKNCYPSKEAGILMTMLLGNKAELESEIKTLYRGAGILHILSVSGVKTLLLA